MKFTRGKLDFIVADKKTLDKCFQNEVRIAVISWIRYFRDRF